MTDNEIKKALECCVNEKADCKGCPYESDGCLIENGKNKLLEDTLDLINRQKAELENQNLEIDILIRKKESLRDEISELSAEVERLKEERDAMHRDVITAEEYSWNLNEKLKTAKSEAISELNAQLYAYKTNIFIKGEELMIIPMSDYNNILKEMVGDAK